MNKVRLSSRLRVDGGQISLCEIKYEVVREKRLRCRIQFCDARVVLLCLCDESTEPRSRLSIEVRSVPFLESVIPFALNCERIDRRPEVSSRGARWKGAQKRGDASNDR